MAMSAVAVLAMQIRKQEDQRKRQRSDEHGDPCPSREAPASSLGYPAGEIHRTDRGDRQQCEEDVGVRGNVATHLRELQSCIAPSIMQTWPPGDGPSSASRLVEGPARSPREPTGRANARQMTGSAISGTGRAGIPDVAAAHPGYAAVAGLIRLRPVRRFRRRRLRRTAAGKPFDHRAHRIARLAVLHGIEQRGGAR